MSILSHILVEAQSPDQQSRENAIKSLVDRSHSNPVSYLLDLSIELSNISNLPQARQLAGILIKNLVENLTQDPLLSNVWQQVDPETKTLVRNNTLGSLASDNNVVRLAASQTVSALACIDIPTNQWPELLGILITNSTNMNKTFKVSALRTLGYICEGLASDIVGKAQADSILTVLASNLDLSETDVEVKLVALTSLRNSLKFICANIANNEERALIFNLLFACCTHEDLSIRKEAIMIICDIATLYYDFIESNLIDLGNLTYSIIKSADIDIAIYAVEFWNQISDEEATRIVQNKPIKGYIATAAASLVPLLLEKVHIFGAEGDDWNMHKACSSTLGSISIIIHDNILQLVGEYITACIEDADMRKRIAAAVIIGFIAEGINDAKLLIQVVFKPMLLLLSDRVLKLRESTAWAISKLCEFHGNAIISLGFFMQIFQELIKLLKDAPTIATHACWTIVNLFKKGSINEFIDQDKLECILNSIFEASIRPDAYQSGHELLIAVYCCFNSIIEEIPDKFFNIFTARIPIFINLLENTINDELRTPAQGHICSAIQAIFGRADSGIVTEADANKFMDVIIRIFSLRNTVVEEGLQAIGSLAENIGGKFFKYLGSVMPFVIWCLDSTSSSLCKSGVIACGDLSRALGHQFGGEIANVIHKLLGILENEQQMFEVKIRVIDTLADFASHNSIDIIPLFSDIFKFIQGAARMSLDPNVEINSSDVFEFFLQLRESIMSFYVGVIQGLHDIHQEEMILGYIPNIIEYSLSIVQEIFKPSHDIHIGAIGIIGDISAHYGSKFTHLIRTPQVSAYLSAAARFDSKGIKDILVYTNERIKNI